MKKVRNKKVIDNWKDGNAACNHRESLHTDGSKLYSYALQIGDTCDVTGMKVLKDYTAHTAHGFQSHTTSCHVGLARMAADIIDG